MERIEYDGHVWVHWQGVQLPDGVWLPFERITSAVASAPGTVEIATIDALHVVRLLSGPTARGICNAIDERMAAMTAYGPHD